MPSLMHVVAVKGSVDQSRMITARGRAALAPNNVPSWHVTSSGNAVRRAARNAGGREKKPNGAASAARGRLAS